jgi:hypothetical protein
MDNEKDSTPTGIETEGQEAKDLAAKSDSATGRATPETPEVAAKVKTSKSEPVKLEMMRSGFMNEADAVVFSRAGVPYLVEGRAVTQEYVQMLVANTNRLMAAGNYNLPVLRGHPELEGDRPEQEQAVEGWIQSLEVVELKEKDRDGIPEVAAVATVMLTGQLKQDFDEGKLPKRSPTWDEQGGKLSDSRRVGPHFVNLAMLGRDQPAMPALSNLAVASRNAQREAASIKDLGPIDKLQDAISKMAGQIKTAITALATKQTAKEGTECAQMENGMTPEEMVEKLMNIQEFLAGAQSSIQELLEEIGKGTDVEHGGEVVEVVDGEGGDMTVGEKKAE